VWGVTERIYEDRMEAWWLQDLLGMRVVIVRVGWIREDSGVGREVVVRWRSAGIMGARRVFRKRWNRTGLGVSGRRSGLSSG
jgi:hypothetical protein